MADNFLLRNLFPLNSKPGCTSVSVRTVRLRQSRLEGFVADQNAFEGRIDNREGGGERLLALLAS